MEEVWKDIRWFEGLYQVSNTGRVRSLPRDLEQPIRRKNGEFRKEVWHYKGKELRPMKIGRGLHVSVRLYNRRKERFTYRVSELVLEAFAPELWTEYCTNRCKIEYKDNNMWNCNINNLQVVNTLI